jgi:uncharacterized protein
MRSIPPDFAPETVAQIDHALDGIIRDDRVAMPLAVESGSRAWGFPSPDSDYDCRFVYVRSADQYVSPWVARDVIELPLAGDLDINGWDLGKALKLMLKGNAVIIEWLQSPLIYRGNAEFRDEFTELARRHADRGLVARHYLHLGERQRRVHFGDGENVPLKKLFYALRPAATLRWMRGHPDQRVAPMHFPTLMAGCDPPADVAGLVADLLARKAVTRELGSAPLPACIARFVDDEFTEARAAFGDRPSVASDAARAEATAFFQATVRKFG